MSCYRPCSTQRPGRFLNGHILVILGEQDVHHVAFEGKYMLLRRALGVLIIFDTQDLREEAPCYMAQ